MADGLHLYLRYVSLSLRGQMQYRVSFLLQSFSQFAVNFIEFLAIWALFHRFGSLRDWTFPEVAFLYGLVNSTWAVVDATSRGFDAFGALVKSGDFDRLLLRPRSTALQLAGQELTLRRIGRFLQGFIVLMWSITVLPIAWSPAKVLLLMFAGLGGYCLFYGLLVLQATLCFWTTESLEIMNVFTYGGLETARYPMTIYGPRFRTLFTFVIPLACVCYFPSTVILNKPDLLGYPTWFPWMAPSLGIVFLLMASQVWRFGVRHYQSTGS